MDGNIAGRKAREDPGPFGHVPVRVRLASGLFAANNGIDALTLYAFSSENWNRPAQEVSVNGAVCVGAG